jgi:hypothetical protein
MATVNGATVIEVRERPSWQSDDDWHALNHGVIVGRAEVRVEGGGLFHGLVFLRPFQRNVVIWEKTTGRFAVIQLPNRL